MKHAVLITAYKNFNQLENLVNQFDENFNIYIHFDKKSKLNKTLIHKILKNNNVECLEYKYTVNWGGLNHLKAYLLLCEKALKNKENIYFHLITGQDFPIRSNKFIIDFFNATDEKIDYLEYFTMPAAIWWKDGGMGRLKYFNFYDLFNSKSSLGKKCIYYAKKIQIILNVKRSMKFEKKLYGGSTYWSLSRKTLQFVIDFTEQNPVFFKRFKYTFCAEEMYFQTVIMNSEYSKNIVNDNLRYIDWENGNEESPALLDENDYEKIINSNKLFARKIDSTKLKQMLTMYKNNRL